MFTQTYMSEYLDKYGRLSYGHFAIHKTFTTFQNSRAQLFKALLA